MPRKSETIPVQNALTQSAQSQQELLMEGIENFELPRTLITRIAKSALGGDAKLQKDTVLALSKSSTVFINYLAATAQDVARSRSVKTITSADVLKALEMLEFNDQVELMQKELEIYRNKESKNKDKRKRPSMTQEKTSPATRSKVNGGSTTKGKERAMDTEDAVGSSTHEPLPPAFDLGPHDNNESRPESRASNFEDEMGYTSNEEGNEVEADFGHEDEDLGDEDVDDDQEDVPTDRMVLDETASDDLRLDINSRNRPSVAHESTENED